MSILLIRLIKSIRKRLPPQFRRCGSALIFGFGIALASPHSEAADLIKTVLVTDCENPMQLEVLPGGQILYVERYGTVKLWDPRTKTSAVVTRREVEARSNSSTPPSMGAWESGLLGLAVDSAFSRTHWVYLYYSPSGGHEFRVSRLTLQETPINLSDEKVLLTIPVDMEVCCHYAGGLGFDGQGNLYISTGDNTIPLRIRRVCTHRLSRQPPILRRGSIRGKRK